ncbi:MAG: patatin-like phospholipase family protein [Desulfuromonadales bacterium]
MPDSNDTKNHHDLLALVFGGGGAHAAYEVGFLRGLASHYPELDAPILTGVSAGALNAVFLANHRGPFAVAVEDLSRLWQNLTIEQVFRTDSISLLKNLLHWQISLVSGGLIQAPSGRGMVDPSPLRTLLEGQFATDGTALGGIRENLRRGHLKALAISATDYCADRAVTWVQGKEIASWDRPHRYGVTAELTIDHIMASAALPLFFPAVRVEDCWFGDGGLRQTAPLAPALHLGAQRILAVSTRYEKPDDGLSTVSLAEHPPPAQVIGTLLNAIFLDLFLQDAQMMERINRLLAERTGDTASGFRHIDFFLQRPSRNISELADTFQHDLPKMFRYLVRGLGTHRAGSPGWLSIVMFDTSYLREMMAIGEADARDKMTDIAAVIEGTSP